MLHSLVKMLFIRVAVVTVPRADLGIIFNKEYGNMAL